MESQKNSFWAPVSYEDKRREDEPRFVAREASSTGGLGFDTDYGQTEEDFARAGRDVIQQREEEEALQRLRSARPLSAAAASATLGQVVRLG